MAEISVITVVKNDESGLVETFNSLALQTLHSWELIIVAAYSSDDTLEKAKLIEEQDSRVTFLLEELPGIYSAMNQGVRAANSDLVWFMNAGDCFYSNSVLERSVNLFKTMDTDLIVGGHAVKAPQSQLVYNFRTRFFGKMNFAFNRRYGCHQSMLFRKSRIEELGYFDLNFEFASDYDLVLRMLRKTQGYRDDQTYSLIKPDGIADSNLSRVHQEKYVIRNRILLFPGAKFLSLVWMYLAFFKLSLKSRFSIRLS